MAIYALIPAAGSGSRIGGPLPKQYRPVAGQPLLTYALEVMATAPEVAGSFIVLAPDDSHFDKLTLSPAVVARTVQLHAGGATRHESVLGGLDQIADRVHADDWILVHDAARPGLTVALVTRLIEAVSGDDVGGLLALPVADTLKREGDHERGHLVAQTLARAGLWQAQTPQMFRYGLLRRALRGAVDRGIAVTDEASAVEALGLRPRLVLGSAMNFKVTHPDDLELAERMLGSQRP